MDLQDPYPEFIDNVTIVGIIVATVVPILLLCVLACRKCRRQRRVQPVKCKKKKKSCCCKDEPQLPEKQNRSTTTGTYLNQPPLPVEEPVYQGTPSAPAMSLPPTPTDK
jgi:hypothetical protein